ncbi:MAG TPA: TM2 domain-containing protein [Ktedonobacteraceae bacterium]|nr:TM2 domain-containing protein [Ktedonobacteraceae bacterium]
MAYNQGPVPNQNPAYSQGSPITDQPPMYNHEYNQVPVTGQPSAPYGQGVMPNQTPYSPQAAMQGQYLPKKWSTALLLCAFLGPFGAHRFYVGKTGTAIAILLLTFIGVGGIWSLIDLIMIATGSFKDKNDQFLVSPYPRNPMLAPGQGKSLTTTLLLCMFLGVFGAHRFYVGKTGTAIVMLLTSFLGVSAIWTLVDFIMIGVGSFKAKNEQPIVCTW